ncbi:SIAH2, partial [Cordylochernes scorpioides]
MQCQPNSPKHKQWVRGSTVIQPGGRRLGGLLGQCANMANVIAARPNNSCELDPGFDWALVTMAYHRLNYTPPNKPSEPCLINLVSRIASKRFNQQPRCAATASLVGGSSSSSIANAELASAFECPVCFDYVLPPILQCRNGHLVCSTCRPKVQNCPTCRSPMGAVDAGNIRNLAMEKVASTVLFPCKYSISGCPAEFLHTEKTEHEELCEFRPYLCPCPGASCKWMGNLEEVMAHLMQSHKTITTLQGEDIVFLATDINLAGAVDWVMMQSCFRHHFMLVLEKQEKYDGYQQFYALVQLIGSRKQAENFIY